MDRKFNILILSIAVMAMFASCKEVDPLAGTELGEMGIQSVTAAFTGEVYENDVNAKFSALPDADGHDARRAETGLREAGQRAAEFKTDRRHLKGK